MNKKSDGLDDKIRVFARCRPMNSMEKTQSSNSMMEFAPGMSKVSLKTRKTSKEYLFDQVFSPDSEQIAVYEAVVEPLIQEVLKGYSCTVFAYGQTGTGKTYTMEGGKIDAKCSWRDDPSAGIIPRSLHQLFEELNQTENVEFSVKVSFFEIYNEEVYDLLSSSDFTKLRLYEDPRLKDSVKIKGLEEVNVKTKDEVYDILEKGATKRHTAETKLNACSSRSHAVFTVTVSMIEKTSNGFKVERIGKLNLVDLAGSENVRRSGAINKRAKEAANINQSLLTLGRVFTALIEKQSHVPYRESKLTRILQYSLGGHAKTSIIATISPAQCNWDETIRTLDYAAKAKTIDINPESNRRLPLKEIVKELSKENERLRMENEDMARDLIAAKSNHGFRVDAKNNESMVQKITLMDLEIKTLKSENLKLHQEAALARKDIEKFTAQIKTQALAYKNEDVCVSLRKLSQKQCADLYDIVTDYNKKIIKFVKCFKDDQDHINCLLEQQKQESNCLRESIKDSLVSSYGKFATQTLSSLLTELDAHKAVTDASFAKLDNSCVELMCRMPEGATGSGQGLIQLSLILTSWLKDLRKFQVGRYEELICRFKSNNNIADMNKFSNLVDSELSYLEDVLSPSGGIFDEFEERTSKSAAHLQQVIIKNALEMENSISEFVKNVPTGIAPQQRAYNFPRNPRVTLKPGTHAGNKGYGSNKENRQMSRLPRRTPEWFSKDIPLGSCNSEGFSR